MLRAYTYENTEWTKLLPAIEFAYNNSIQSSTKLSPFYCVNGQNPILPADFLIKTIESSNPTASEFAAKVSKAIQTAQENLKEATDYQTEYANLSRREVIFSEGEEVLLSTKFIKDKAQADKVNKLKNPYCGPFKVTQVISPVVYKLDLPSYMKIHPVFHVSLLKKYSKSEIQRIQPPPPTIAQDQEEYEVEKILDKKTSGKKTWYLVKWKGYPDSDRTWESKTNLRKAKESIEDFEKGKET